MQKIIRIVYKILILTAGFTVLGICLPFILIFALLVNFIEWIKREWKKNGYVCRAKKGHAQQIDVFICRTQI